MLLQNRIKFTNAHDFIVKLALNKLLSNSYIPLVIYLVICIFIYI